MIHGRFTAQTHLPLSQEIDKDRPWKLARFRFRELGFACKDIQLSKVRVSQITQWATNSTQISTDQHNILHYISQKTNASIRTWGMKDSQRKLIFHLSRQIYQARPWGWLALDSRSYGLLARTFNYVKSGRHESLMSKKPNTDFCPWHKPRSNASTWRWRMKDSEQKLHLPLSPDIQARQWDWLALRSRN